MLERLALASLTGEPATVEGGGTAVMSKARRLTPWRQLLERLALATLTGRPQPGSPALAFGYALGRGGS